MAWYPNHASTVGAMSKMNYQKLNAERYATTDNRAEGTRQQYQDLGTTPPTTGKKRKRWSGECRARAKWQDKGEFVRKHNLACCSCGDKSPHSWAVARMGKNHRPYAYCTACFRRWKLSHPSG